MSLRDEVAEIVRQCAEIARIRQEIEQEAAAWARQLQQEQQRVAA